MRTDVIDVNLLWSKFEGPQNLFPCIRNDSHPKCRIVGVGVIELVQLCQQILEGKELLNERTDAEYKYLKKVFNSPLP